ncbi:hypothetical protein KM043_017381 [Ampulex compressa]|nr:hypothetical protein KM043_017381 [Ampulex compressa]
MADRSVNLLAENRTNEALDEPSSQYNSDGRPSCNVTNGRNGLPKREGLYTKREQSGYQRSATYQKDQSPTHQCTKKAPIVGWQYGSPTVFPSSPCKSPDDHGPCRSGRETSISRSTDSTYSEGLSSMADERLQRSTPARTIDRSLESLSPDTLLTTSPHAPWSKDLSFTDDTENRLDLPSTDGRTIDGTPTSLNGIKNELVTPDDCDRSSWEREGRFCERNYDGKEALVNGTKDTEGRNIGGDTSFNGIEDNIDVESTDSMNIGTNCKNENTLNFHNVLRKDEGKPQGILVSNKFPETDNKKLSTLELLSKDQLRGHETSAPIVNGKIPKEPTTESSTKTQGILVHRKYSDTEPTANLEYRDDGTRDSIDTDSLDLENQLDSSSLEQSEKKPKIPDGGWGWVVVLASLVISMIADGVSFSFGLLYIEFLHEFGASKSKTAWIGSLFMAVPLLSGPVMSALVDRYGCRSMTIAGGLISGLGFVLSCFSNTIEVMYLTFGVIAGLGLGLGYVTAVVSVAYWFDKKRTLAVGLGACGTGIGTFVYAPMTTYFIEEYGWRGTCLLLAGTFFNMIVCGSVMRDPEWWVLEQRKQALATPKKSSARSEAGRSTASPTDEFPGLEELKRLLKSGQTPECLRQSVGNGAESPKSVEANAAFRSVVNLPTFVKQSEKVPVEVLESLSGNSRLYNVILENYPSLLLCGAISEKKLYDSVGELCEKSGITISANLQDWIKQAVDRARQTSPKKDSRPGSTHASTKVLAARRMSRKELEENNPLLAKELALAMAEAERAKSVSRHHIGSISGGVVRTDSIPWLRRQFNTNTHYFKDIKVHRNSVMYRGAALNLKKYRLRASSCPDIYRNSMTTLAKENVEKWYSELAELLKGMLDFSMFLELHFLLLSLSTILLFTWFIVPYFYLAEHLTRNGYTESDAANLLSIIGITNTIGMIALGWAGDQPWMNVSKTYTWCLMACGLATILMSVFTHNYVLLMITSAAFGLFFASSFSFTPVILVELIPLERFTTAYGLILLCQGIGNLLGPPLAGWMFDVTHSWEMSFLMAGGWIIFSGVLMGIIPYTKNRKIWGKGPVERERDCMA